MKNTKIAMRAYETVENHIDLSIRSINAGVLSYSFCGASIHGELMLIESLGFISLDELLYIDEAVGIILPVNLKLEHR